MWFGFKEDNNWYPLNIDRGEVKFWLMNLEGKRPASLEINQEEAKVPLAKLNSDLENLDRKFKDKSKNRKKKNKNHGHNRGQAPKRAK
ncbi:MAG: hypothetical protein U5K54_10470 [Cytophagales bacterium]|nr:hypothetical protein [Cytophagales bacterium]